jgi:Fe-S-cluster containining protein
VSKAPRDEQEICLTCGLCCDGTMFDFVFLSHDEGASLAAIAEIERRADRATLPSPCAFLRGCACSIYESRPRACRKFRCKTLRDLSAGRIERDEALARIAAVKDAFERVRPWLAPGESLWSARRRRTELLAEKRSMRTEEGEFVLRSAALDLLLERHFRIDGSRLFAAEGE